MKKRLLWCGFTFAVVLLILMISTENNIIQRIPFFDMSTINNIKCYDEVSSAEGIRDFDAESSNMTINYCYLLLLSFFLVSRIRESGTSLWFTNFVHSTYAISDKILRNYNDRYVYIWEILNIKINQFCHIYKIYFRYDFTNLRSFLDL